MQKIIRRSEYVHKYAARKGAEKKKLKDKLHQREDHMRRAPLRRARREDIKLYKQERWDALHRGPLAPRYDIGTKRDTYGTVPVERATRSRVFESDQKECPFVKGDTVALWSKEYKDYGKMGKILTVDKKTQSITIEGLNRCLTWQPPYVRQMMQTEDQYQLVEMEVLWDDCRLVWFDPTLAPKGKVIQELKTRRPTLAEKGAGHTKPIRSFLDFRGVERFAPYPETKEPDYGNTDSDTLRIEVENLTFVPTLGIPPMPPNVIDELRNKYSKFRTRFDDEFIARKEALAAAKLDKARALKEAARTPFDEINLANRSKLLEERRQNAQEGAWKPLTPEIVEGIAKLGLQTAEKTGKILPSKTKYLFDAIQARFKDDSADVGKASILMEEQAAARTLESDERSMEIRKERLDEEAFENIPVEYMYPTGERAAALATLAAQATQSNATQSQATAQL